MAKVEYYTSKNRDAILQQHFTSQQSLYDRLMTCSSIYEMRILFDVFGIKLAVQEWLYFILMLCMAKQYPNRYVAYDEETINMTYQMIYDEICMSNSTSYLGKIFTNSVFIKTLFKMLSTKDTLQFKNKIFLLALFQKVFQQFPDLKKWTYFMRNRKMLDLILSIKVAI